MEAIGTLMIAERLSFKYSKNAEREIDRGLRGKAIVSSEAA